MYERVSDCEWVFVWKSERVVTRKGLWAKWWVCGSAEDGECMNELVGEHVRWIAGDYVSEYWTGSNDEEVLLRVNEQRNILHEIRKRKAKSIGHILRRNCLLKQVIEGKVKGEIEVTRRRGRRRKKLLDDLKDRGGYSYLKEEALDHTMWRNRFGRGVGPVVRQNTEWWP